jgi:hypothetical protein
MTKKFSRRNFLDSTAGLAAAGMFSMGMGSDRKRSSAGSRKGSSGADEFAKLIEKELPEEKPYDYHKRLSTEPVHKPGRDPEAKLSDGEMAIGDGWKLVCNTGESIVLQNSISDFRDYLEITQGIRTEVDSNLSREGWQGLSKAIIAGTRDQLPGCGAELKGTKDYEIIVTPERIVVCGFDDKGTMHGLYNLEERMNLREAPFLPSDLKTVRHSLYNTRMALSWMGWMEFPDQLLSHMAHDGFDGIFAGVYTNPNGDRTTADNSTDFYARLMHLKRMQDPKKVRDLIDRAARFGIRVYTQIIFQYMGTPESEKDLRRIVRENIKEFPDLGGFVLLTEGFWYKRWGGGHGADRAYIEDWARNWCRAVAIVAEESHKVNPQMEILPWEYNINFHPRNADVKRYFITQLPSDAIPLLTWENGKSFEIDGMKGFLRDYSLNQVGPAEVTEAQIEQARQRGMTVYSKADTSTSWQYGTSPYLPCPYQWYDRYMALEKFGIKGTLESWSNGYKPNFITEIRSWTCWTGSPNRDDLFAMVAAKMFGKAQTDNVLKAWDHFSQAIRLIPDTGPNMGTNNAVGNPIFFREPSPRTATFDYSWFDQAKMSGYTGGRTLPIWPYTVFYLIFFPDFSNRVNKAENYARSVSGIEAPEDKSILQVLLKYLKIAADHMEEGLKLYRDAAARCPVSKREAAVREVIVAEHIERNMRSAYAILEFEDLRLKFEAARDKKTASDLLNRMEGIILEETNRTELALIAAKHDSRLGFQFEQDYVYTPFSLKDKLSILEETLNIQIPEAREQLK